MEIADLIQLEDAYLQTCDVSPELNVTKRLTKLFNSISLIRPTTLD